jgi:hypothetical protein
MSLIPTFVLEHLNCFLVGVPVFFALMFTWSLARAAAYTDAQHNKAVIIERESNPFRK